MERLLLAVRGRWHRPLPNEPLTPPGWEEAFSLLAGGPAAEHCSMILSYKLVSFQDFATNEMVEAASRFDLERCVELALEKFMHAPEDVVELDALPQQVAAAAALSRHRIVKALVQGGQATVSRGLTLSPLEILRELYSWPQGGTVELRLTIGPSDWKTVKAAAHVQNLTPEDGLAVLKGNGEKKAELLSLLKAMSAEVKRVGQNI